VERLLTDPSYRAAAQRIGDEITRSPGPAGIDAALGMAAVTRNGGR
jgi:UDP:flavonoid glycosyltransferase YjiC (YdhE family)